MMVFTRSGDIVTFPSFPCWLSEAGMQLDEVMALLNKKSGLMGVSTAFA